VSGAGWTLIGAPVDSAGAADAEARAPAALRAAGLVERLGAVDRGDAGVPLRDPVRHANGVLGFDAVVAFSAALREAVADALAGEGRPLVVGGDCTLLLGVFAALRDAGRRPGLWFVDGHADFYDGDTSPTGEAADMELAILTGHGPAGLVDLGGEPPLVEPERALILGHRPVGVGADVAEEIGFVPDAIGRVDADAVRRRGAADVGREAEATLAPIGDVWLHLDLDVLESELFPAVSYRQPDGLDWEQLTTLLGPLLASPALAGVSIADYNPAEDRDGAYASLLVEQLTPLLAAVTPR
jgi:arginase